MSSHECTRCDGTGREGMLGTGTYGPVFSGACSFCGGKGYTHESHTYTKDPFWYLTAAELDEMKRENQAAAEYHAQLQDYWDAHEHYLN